jgi:hypothetical protein
MIAPMELKQNYERLDTLYGPNQPIKTLFQKIQDVRAFAIAGEHPYGVTLENTWTQFKIDFATTH